MSKTLKPLGVRDFIAKYMLDESLFDALPEFSFIKPVAVKAKAKNCTCGLGQDINRAIMVYNDFVNTLEYDLLFRVKDKFEIDKACFVIQTADTYEVKCYG